LKSKTPIQIVYHCQSVSGHSRTLYPRTSYTLARTPPNKMVSYLKKSGHDPVYNWPIAG